MLRTHSVDLYLSSSPDRTPDSCEELAFIILATSVEEALRLALDDQKKNPVWKDWRVFEANAQEIEPAQNADQASSRILRGPFQQNLVRQTRKKWLGLF